MYFVLGMFASLLYVPNI